MSPTEDDLRSALSDGAGDIPNVDHIVFVAHERRAQRRKRALSVAGAVVLVGALGTGGTFLVKDSRSTESAAGSGGVAADSAAASAGGGGAAGSATPAPSRLPSGTDAPSAGTTCPSHVPSQFGGGVARQGSAGALFAEPVDTVTVCAYLTGISSGSPTSVQLTGSGATTFVASLENAPRTRSNRACPDYRLADQKTLAIIASTADGKQLPTVTAAINEPSCAVVVTNGTAVRYGWSWPSSLRSGLARLSDGTSRSAGASGGPLH